MKKFLKGFAYAINGLNNAILSEHNLKLHILIASCVIVLSYVLHLSAIEWAIILGCIALVIGAELMNTAIEKTVDLVSPTFNPKAGLIKDISAGAVLVCAIVAAIIGVLIFLPKI